MAPVRSGISYSVPSNQKNDGRPTMYVRSLTRTFRDWSLHKPGQPCLVNRGDNTIRMARRWYKGFMFAILPTHPVLLDQQHVFSAFVRVER